MVEVKEVYVSPIVEKVINKKVGAKLDGLKQELFPLVKQHVRKKKLDREEAYLKNLLHF